MVHFGQSIFAFGRLHIFKFLLSALIVILVVNFATNLTILRTTSRKRISEKLVGFTSGGNTPDLVDFLESNVTFSSKDDRLVKVVTEFSSYIGIPSTPANFRVRNGNLPLCPHRPTNLIGPLKVATEAPPFHDMESMFPDLKFGGRFVPRVCNSRHKVAVVIPYRDREEHLRIFLFNLHPMLMRQQLDYGIYVVEQHGEDKFNKGMLMNVGFVEALKQHDYQCFIFHDVDLIPEDDRNIYSCPEQPRHMSVAIDSMKYRLPYRNIFGGVSALMREHMEKVNGYSNEFWGWGGEDDDFSLRLIKHGYRITRYPANIARYKMLNHSKAEPNPDRIEKFYKGSERYNTDGLVNLKYELYKLEPKKLYTWLLVKIRPL